MPPGLPLALPAALLAAAAVAAWFAGAAGLRLVARPLVAAAAWGALATHCLLWLPTRNPIELFGPVLIPGARVVLRLDAVSFAFGLSVLMPAAILLTFQRRGWRESGAAALTLAAALLAVVADGVITTALFWGSAATLLLVQHRGGSERATEAWWPALAAGWLALIWAGGTLEVVGGTAVYTAVPVNAMTAPTFLLLAVAALLGSGLVPWRPWTAAAWDRPRLQTSSLAIACLFPVGFYLLVRAYAAGGGRWPSLWLNVALAGLGVLVAMTAAVRAQSATTRRSYLAEALPGLGGFALLAFALGTPGGVSAGMATVLVAAVLAALLPLLPEGDAWFALVALALVAGLPPAATFAARALTVEAGIEAGGGWAFLVVAAAIAWLLAFAAAARAVRLPVLGMGAEPGGSGPGAELGAEPGGSAAGAALAGLALVGGGAGFGLLVARICLPATAEVMQVTPDAVGGGGVAVLTTAGAWAAVALGGPLLLLAILPALGARGAPVPVLGARGAAAPARAAPAIAPGTPPPPLFTIPGANRPRRLAAWMAAQRVPEQYQSLVNPRAVEAAMGRGQPLLWAVLLLALAVAVNR